MAPQQATNAHHHRSTTKTAHKPFKAKHATKGALKDKQKGKVESLERGLKSNRQQYVMSKQERRNQAKQKRLVTNAEHARSNSIFNGVDAAPRIVAVVPLCADVVVPQVMRSLATSIDFDTAMPTEGNDWQIDATRFKQKIRFIAPAKRELWETLDVCRTADFVLFVMSPEQEVDALGDQALRCIESQGVSNVMAAVQNLSSVGVPKKQHLVQDSLKSFITHFFATQEKVHSLDSRQECVNVMRSLCTTTPKGIRWREDRSWMLVEESACSSDGQLQITGVVRGRPLNPDRLVQVGDLGDFQIQKVVLAVPAKRVVDKSAMALDESSDAVRMPTTDRDDLIDLAPEEIVMHEHPAPSLAASDRKGVLLDDHHYFEDGEMTRAGTSRRLPRGTSDYQAAWYLDDIDYSGSDLESANGDTNMGDDADGQTEQGDFVMPDATEGAPSEYPQSEAFMDPSPADEANQLAEYRASKRDEATDDLEFPDEIELEPTVLARERLSKYRGLKSLRSSAWDMEEDKPYEPEDWRRLLEVANYKAAKARVVNEALVGGIAPGTRVQVYLSLEGHDMERLRAASQPRAMFSLLRHEHKNTAVNCSINLSNDHEEAIKSKEEIVMQCGPRRLVINPLFSELSNARNNVHKFDRYLHPGQNAVASFVGPMTWGSVPCIYLKRTSDVAETQTPDSTAPQYTLLGTGTSLPPSTNRIIAKRIVLTGHPYKIHKRVVTIRYMFFNQADIEWFKALQLWTKRGRSGFIKESLGTHGYFKANFDAKINPQDAVAVSLYKRVWPKWARRWMP